MLHEGFFLPRVVLLMGEEPYYIDRIENAIVDHYIPTEDRDTERIILYGADSLMSDVALQAQSSSLFAEKRLVVLREAQLVKDFDKIISLIPKIPRSSTLVVSYRSNFRKNKLLTALQAYPEDVVLIVDSPAIKNNRDILAVITQVASNLRVHIDDTAKARLLELVGFSGCTMQKELEKLAIAAGNTPITRELVDKLVSSTRRYSIFDLTQEIERKNKLEVLRLGELISDDEKNYPLPMITSALYDFFSNVMAVHYLPVDQRTPTVIAGVLGLKGSFQSDKYIRAVNRYSAQATFEIIHAIRMTDAAFKGAEQGDYRSKQLLMNLLFTICR